MEPVVEKAFEELFRELRFMVQNLRNGQQINIHRALEVIGMIERNVTNMPCRGDFQYCRQQIIDEARKQGLF